MAGEEPRKMKTAEGERVTVIWRISHTGDSGGGGGGISVGGGGGGFPTGDAEAPPTAGDGPEATGTPAPTASGRIIVNLPFNPAGMAGRSVQLAAGPAVADGIGHPANTGSAIISIRALDANGTVIGAVDLNPGQSLDWYHAPEGTASIVAADIEVDSGYGQAQITYDLAVV